MATAAECIDIISLVIKLLNVFMHSISIYLISNLRNKERNTPQMSYILNLCITELIINSKSFIRNLVKSMMYSFHLQPIENFNSTLYEEIMMYNYIIDYSILKLSLICTMFYITFDRVVMILTPLSYRHYWNPIKAKRLILCTWTATLIPFSASVSFYEITNDVPSFFSVCTRVTISLDILFVIVATPSYYQIFRKYKQRRIVPTLQINCYDSKTMDTLRHPRYYLAFFLVLSFIVFIVTTDLIWWIANIINGKDVSRLARSRSFMLLQYPIGYLSDSFVYIFGQRKVRRVMMSRVRRMRTDQSARTRMRVEGYRTRTASPNVRKIVVISDSTKNSSSS